jgi:hypothetical protein
VGCCEHDKKPSRFVKSGRFLNDAQKFQAKENFFICDSDERNGKEIFPLFCFEESQKKKNWEFLLWPVFKYWTARNLRKH